MKNPSCPYLGMEDDPTTALDFPSEGNFCHRARPIAPVNKIHQQRYCLTAGHFGCPVYTSARPKAMPPALLPPSVLGVQAARVTRRLAAFLLPPIIFGIAVLGLVLWIVAPQVFGLDRSMIPDTGDETSGDTSFNLFSFGDARDITLTPFLPQFGESAGQMAVPNCPQPAGWATYIANPTDSLFRLSVVYGVPVEELQRMNCKEKSDTVILPGQVIYVPATLQGTLPSAILGQGPTAFPTFTPPSVRQPVQATSTSSDSRSNPPAPTKTPMPSPTSPPAFIPTLVTATPALPTPTLRPTNTNPPPATATIRPTNTPRPPTATPQPTNTPKPTNTPRPPKPTSTPKPTNTPLPPVTATIPPTPTDPPPTATNPPPPTATTPPTATEPPPPTATDPPPPTATDPPPPTATDPPPPTATDPPPPTEPPPPVETEIPPTDPPEATSPPAPTDPPPTIETNPPPDVTEPPPDVATPPGSIEQTLLTAR